MKFAYILLLPFVIAAASCSGNKNDKSDSRPFLEQNGMVWNTEFHITFQGDESLKDSVIAVLDSAGRTLSVFDPNSMVSKVNRQDSTPVNTDFIRVYVASRKISRLTGGAFDPTLSPLITAWGFGPGHKATSDTARIDSIMRYVGIEKTRLNYDALVKEDIRTEFNFSAIAKGFGCDLVGEMFNRNGVSNFLVEIGGEIRASGNSPRNGVWNVSVDAPVFSDSTIVHDSQNIIGFTGMGMATSGNYRNFRKENGVILGHTISAVTGRPVTTDVLSATVLAPSSMEADALATAFMALGMEESKKIVMRLRLPVMLIGNDTVWQSPQLKKFIVE